MHGHWGGHGAHLRGVQAPGFGASECVAARRLGDACDVDHTIEYTDGGETTQDNGRLRCGPHNRQRPGRRRPPSGSEDDDDDLDADDGSYEGDPHDDAHERIEPEDETPVDQVRAVAPDWDAPQNHV